MSISRGRDTMVPELRLEIDIVDKCNLRCRSCPRGNSPDVQLQRGRMEPELLDRIMKKATGECRVKSVNLFNWTEPFLHPELSRMIEVINSYGIKTGLSSNLNIMPKIDDVMHADPEFLIISVSGFTQGVYERNHRGGDIERVKKNMEELAGAKERTKSRTRIEVKYLLYLGNLDEAVLMKEYADSLGFSFVLSYMGLMPLEKLLMYVSNDPGGDSLSEEEREIAKTIIFPYREVIELARPYKKLPCLMLEESIMINCLGNVQLCCMVYDDSKYTIADYLTTPIAEIQNLKRNHWQCADCIEYGIAAARSWRILNMDREVLKKFSLYYKKVGLDVSSIRDRGRIRSRLLPYYLAGKARLKRDSWLRTQYHRFKKILPH
jgi:MoaA/NifB/PqqE/SkfB family radical SAM enzyme